MRSIVRLLAGGLLFAAVMSSASAKIWYVSDTGSLSGTGESVATAFRQPSQAAPLVAAGDTVILFNGDYDPFTVTVSGTAAAPITWKANAGATPRVIFSNAAIATLVTQRSTAPNINFAVTAALRVQASYQVFDGINFTGNNDLITSNYLEAARADARDLFERRFLATGTTVLGGQDSVRPYEGFNIRGIVLDNSVNGNWSNSSTGNNINSGPAAGSNATLAVKADNLKWHGLTIKNCIIQKFPDAGVAVIQSDYFVFENNRVYENGWYGSVSGINPSPSGNPLGAGGSGMGAAGVIFSPYNLNTSLGYHNVIRRNKIWANEAKFQRKGCFATASTLYNTSRPPNILPTTFPVFTVCGGAGISIEGYPSNVSTIKQYTGGRTLIANNLIVANGGSAIQTVANFLSGTGNISNVDIFNNTLYKNQASPRIINDPGEINLRNPDGVNVRNNIIWPSMLALSPTRTARTFDVGAAVGVPTLFGNNLYWTDDINFKNCVPTACASAYLPRKNSSDRNTDPLFLNANTGNPDNSNFSFAFNSPAKNNGFFVGNIGIDLNGGVRPAGTLTSKLVNGVTTYANVASEQLFDIGAIEFIEPPYVLINQKTDRGVVGNDYQYSIRVYNGASLFSATGLPPGLSINSATGVVSGVPTTAGRFVANVTASSKVRNEAGAIVDVSNTSTVVFRVTVDLPSYFGSLNDKTYYCTGYCNKPAVDSADPNDKYFVTGLPPGLSINPDTGVISGTPTANGTYTVEVTGRGVTKVIFTIGSLPTDWSIGTDTPNATITNAIPGGVYGSSDAKKWTLSGRTVRIANNADSYVSSWQTVSGDVTITAKFLGFSSEISKSAAGVMIRQSTAPDSAHAATLVSPIKGVTSVRRLLQGDVTRSTRGYKLVVNEDDTIVPVWIRIQRQGDSVTSSYSLDGLKWNVIRVDALRFFGDIQVGLVVASSEVTESNTADFSDVSVTKQ
jgi:regulation of enolase protein 1 (concanavalin A-like superfamily)